MDRIGSLTVVFIGEWSVIMKKQQDEQKKEHHREVKEILLNKAKYILMEHLFKLSIAIIIAIIGLIKLLFFT